MFEPLHGRQLMLCNVIYQQPSKTTQWKHDYITMVYRDLITGEKSLFTITDPTYVVYVLKPEFRTFDPDNTRHSMPLEQCDPHEICYKDRYRFIAETSSNLPFLTTHKKEKERRELYRYAYIFGADVAITTYYRLLWEKELGNELRKQPTCCFLDIEVDTSEWNGANPIPQEGECPINAISVTDKETNTVFQFLLKEQNNPLIGEFLLDFHEKVESRFHEMFDEFYGTPTWKVYLFDDERDLIIQCFKLIHTLKRDFCGIFNMDFDIPYIEERCYKIGLDPIDVFTHPDFPDRTYYYYKDTRQFDFEKRRSYCEVSSYTQFIDVMYLYIGTRRSRGTVRQNNLNAIAKRELGDEKLDYTEVTSMKYFSRTDYALFVLYGAKDTLLLMALEDKCKDIQTYYNSCLGSLCQYKDGLKQTVSMLCEFYGAFLEENEILGHNVNGLRGNAEEYQLTVDDDEDWGDSDDDDDSYDGGMVVSPLNNAPVGLLMFGKRSKWLFGLTADADFSGMYPTNICAYNMFAVALYGKLYIDSMQDKLHYSDDAGTEFNDDLINDNYSHFAQKWLNAPPFLELLDVVSSEMRLEQF